MFVSKLFRLIQSDPSTWLRYVLSILNQSLKFKAQASAESLIGLPVFLHDYGDDAAEGREGRKEGGAAIEFRER